MPMNRAHIERISKALADQTRLMIFEAIAKREQIKCGDIVSLRGVTAATVSHHLKILSDAGLIECRREGQFVRSHNDFVSQGSFAQMRGRVCHPIAKVAAQPNSALGMQQQRFPGADRRQPQLIVHISQFVLYAT